MVYIQNKLRTGSLQSMTSATMTSVGPSQIWISMNHSGAAPLMLLSGDRNKNFNPIKYFKSFLFLCGGIFILLWTRIAKSNLKTFCLDRGGSTQRARGCCNILQYFESQRAARSWTLQSQKQDTLELVKKIFLQLCAQHTGTCWKGGEKLQVA